MYGKVFEQMYDGTLASKGPWQALVTFQQMIVLAEKNGVLDMTAEALSRRTTIPLDIIQIGIAALEQPDPESRTPDEEGRRIVRLRPDRSWGWRLVNHEHYRKIRSAEERREYHRNYKRDQRAGVDSQHRQPRSTNSSKQEAVSKKQKASTPSAAHAARTADDVAFDAVWSVYPKRHSASANPKGRARKAWNARRKEGVTATVLFDGTIRYESFVKATGKIGTEFTMQAATFFGPEKHYDQPWEVSAGSPQQIGRPVTTEGKTALLIDKLMTECVSKNNIPGRGEAEYLDRAKITAKYGEEKAAKIWEAIRSIGGQDRLFDRKNRSFVVRDLARVFEAQNGGGDAGS